MRGCEFRQAPDSMVSTKHETSTRLNRSAATKLCASYQRRFDHIEADDKWRGCTCEAFGYVESIIPIRPRTTRSPLAYRRARRRNDARAGGTAVAHIAGPRISLDLRHVCSGPQKLWEMGLDGFTLGSTHKRICSPCPHLHILSTPRPVEASVFFSHSLLL